ncbi:MAG: competence protein ComEC, partial [Gammaproteobacteria bacterium]
GGEAALLAGDLEARGERRLLARHRRLRAEVLVVPHHGSRSSSTPAFVAAVRPRYAVFPVGYRNRYRFPASEVVARYRAAGARVLETQATGALRFVLDGRPGLGPPWAYREAARRLWHDAPRGP